MQITGKTRLHLVALLLGMLFATSVIYDFVQPVHQQDIYELTETDIANFEDPVFPVPVYLEQVPHMISLAFFTTITAGIACITGKVPTTFVPNLRVHRFISFHQLQIAHSSPAR